MDSPTVIRPSRGTGVPKLAIVNQKLERVPEQTMAYLCLQQKTLSTKDQKKVSGL
jgi:hypothetical protein